MRSPLAPRRVNKSHAKGEQIAAKGEPASSPEPIDPLVIQIQTTRRVRPALPPQRASQQQRRAAGGTQRLSEGGQSLPRRDRHADAHRRGGDQGRSSPAARRSGCSGRSASPPCATTGGGPTSPASCAAGMPMGMTVGWTTARRVRRSAAKTRRSKSMGYGRQKAPAMSAKGQSIEDYADDPEYYAQLKALYAGGSAASCRLRQTDCSCKFGLIDPPAVANKLRLVEERTEQYAAGLLRFCDCRLGQGAQRFYAERAQNPYGKQLAEEAGRRRAGVPAEDRRAEGARAGDQPGGLHRQPAQPGGHGGGGGRHRRSAGGSSRSGAPLAPARRGC